MWLIRSALSNFGMEKRRRFPPQRFSRQAEVKGASPPFFIATEMMHGLGQLRAPCSRLGLTEVVRGLILFPRLSRLGGWKKSLLQHGVSLLTSLPGCLSARNVTYERQSKVEPKGRL